MFHLKRFGTIEALNLTRPHTSSTFGRVRSRGKPVILAIFSEGVLKQALDSAGVAVCQGGLPLDHAGAQRQRFICNKHAAARYRATLQALRNGAAQRFAASETEEFKREGSRMSATEAIHFEFFAMGSPCALSLYDHLQGDTAQVAEAATAEVRRIERRYSRYIADSLLCRINRAANGGNSICVDLETADLIDHAFAAHARSHGLFDVTSGLMRQIWNDEIDRVPREAEIAAMLARIGLDKVVWRRPKLTFLVPGMELDFGGVAKEYAADRAAQVCRLRGARHGLVNLGGDIAVVGPHPDGTPWRIGIRDPMGRKAAVATLFVASGGVATSGDY
jgi:thiamine biosynthesis lipoprotein